MKSFKYIDLRTLPQGWTADFFGEIADFSMGKTPARNNDKYWSDGVYPWVSGRIQSTKEKVSEVAHRVVFRDRLAPADSLLMSFKLTIGRVAKLGMPAYHNEAIISFRPKHADVDPDFLFYQLAQINYRKYQDTVVKGQTLNKSKLKQLEIVLPPLIEQRRIADVLRLIRGAIDGHRRLLTLTGELKRAILRQLSAGN
jgi:type I restriction enzyme, S subunit